MELVKVSDRVQYKDDNPTKKIIFKENNFLNFVLNFKPGQGVPPHNHENSDLIIYVITGDGEMVVDDVKNKIMQGDIIHCRGTEIFSLENTGYENMSCLVTLAPNPSPIYSKEL